MFKLYNGCPNRELQDHLDAQAATRKEAASLGIYLCWFPVEERYAASTSLDSGLPYRSLGGFHHTLQSALEEAKPLMAAYRKELELA